MTTTIIIDVHNRCRHRKCKCRGGKGGNISIRTGALGEHKGFGYSTHEVRKKTLKISKVTWTNIPLERKGFVHAFEDLTSVTVYYHNVYDGKDDSIKKPLLIRVKEANNGTHWYENVGTYDNRRWWMIDQEAKSGSYPNRDEYNSCSQFENKLKSVACRLHGLHGINIGSMFHVQQIKCLICSESSNIKFKNGDIDKISDYVKHEYSGTFSGKSVLLHNGNQVMYRMISPLRKGYYVQFQLDDSNVQKVSVYYWDGDTERNNPLLIEIELQNGFYVWLENISKYKQDGKVIHDKWKVLGKDETSKLNIKGSYLKEKLDVLSCVYNGVVKIKVGETVCHTNNHYLHQNRIKNLYNEFKGTDPVLYSYKYWSSVSLNAPLNISEVYIEGKKQDFPKGDIPFKDVKMFVAYVSPCDKDNPFLICVEYGNVPEKYKWYYKIISGTTWQEYPELYKKPPGGTQTKISKLFMTVKGKLGFKDCNVATTAYAIKLNPNEKVEKGKSHTYWDASTGTSKIPITITKEENEPLLGFFKNTHRVNSKSGTFVLSNQLQDQRTIVGFGSKAQSVKNVLVYFWEGDTKEPILLGIKKDDPGDEPTLYGKGTGHNPTWMKGWVGGMNILQALDNQNCSNNNAIPIDLKEPKNLTRFMYSQNSGCLKNKTVVQSNHSLKLPQGANRVYIGQGYTINDGAKISRVTYNGKPTDIIPPYDENAPIVNLYYWTKDLEVPLLVEFIKTDGSDWYENLGKESTKWRKIVNGDEEFYTQNDPSNKTLQEALTTKLNEVNCRVHNVFQIDLSYTGSKYCHIKCPSGKVKVDISEENIDEYNIYEHESVEASKPLILSSILHYGKEQHLGNFSIPKEISKVAVYFPDCNLFFPVAIKIKPNKGDDIWLKRKSPNNEEWEEVTDNFNGVKDNKEEMKELLDVIKTHTSACSQQNRPLAQSYPGMLTQKRHDTGDNRPPGQITTLNQDSGRDDKFDLEEIVSESNIMEKGEKKENGDYDDYLTLDEEMGEDLVKEHTNHTLSNLIHGIYAPTTDITQTSIKSKVTIDIGQNTGHKDTTKLYTVGSRKVKLERKEEPDNSGFYMFTHELPNRDSFEVEEVRYNDREIPGIIPTQSIFSYSVWYWTGDGNNSQPLFIEIEKENADFVYYIRNGTDVLSWTVPSVKSTSSSDPLEEEELEQTLDNLNCKLNRAIAIDLSYKNSDHLSKKRDSGDNKYCCKKHTSDKYKVSVTKESVQVKTKTTTPIPCYKHHIGSGDKLAKIKYYPKDSSGGDGRKRITAKELEFYIDGSLSVYVFYCKEKPVLIYMDSTTKSSAKGWYKKDAEGIPWKRVLIQLSSTTPDNIKECGTQFNKLVNILNSFGCSGYQDCSDIPSSSPQTKVSTQIDHGVIIELKHKPGANPIYQGGTSVTITVTETTQGFDFLKLIHTPNGGSFKLKEVKDDEGDPINGVQGDNVGLIAAHYWKNKTGNPLLIEVQDNGNYTYYARDKIEGWTEYKNPKGYGEALSQESLTHKLILLNCEINDVVQIDVTRLSGEYCHDNEYPLNSHTKKKVKVTETGQGYLGNYTAYEHTPKDSGGPFNISGFTNERTPIKLENLQLPLKTNRVLVYFCKSEVSARTTNPLLIYVPNAGQEKQWFQKPIQEDTWTPVSNGLTDDSHTQAIVNFLDSLESFCKPPEVTIDIYQRGYPNYHNFIYQDGVYPYTNIAVRPKTLNNAKEFTEYIHNITNWYTYFTVNDFKYNGKSIKNGFNKPANTIVEVSVFYYRPLDMHPKKNDERGRPLIVKIVTIEPISKARKSFYYENRGDPENTTWKEWNPTSNPLDADTLQSKLRLLNCSLNHAVVIDIGQKPPGIFGEYKTYDVCDNDKKTLDNNHGDIMQVYKDTPGGKFLSYYDSYAHTLNSATSDTNFHVVGFQNGNAPITIGSTTISSPILGVEELRVYRCNSDNKSLLLYYKTNEATQYWYKNNNPDDKNGLWEVVTGSIRSDTSYNSILTVLDKLTSKCQPPKVTIDISQDSSTGYTSPNSTPPNEQITVAKTEGSGTGDPPSNYDLYEHKVASRPMSYFTLEKLVYGAGDISVDGKPIDPPVKNITSVSVYYWSHLPNGKPLLMKITTTRSQSKPTDVGAKNVTWYENEGTDGDNKKWKKITQPDPQYQLSIDPNILRTKLYFLNCRLNNVVFIDVSKVPGDKYGEEREYDSCNDSNNLDSSHGSRMNVKNITPENSKLAPYYVYEHTLKDSGNGDKFHIVGFEGTNRGSSITAFGDKGREDNPLKNVQKLIIYVCQEELTKPLLIYYTTDGDNHNWYKNNSPDTDNGDQWTNTDNNNLSTNDNPSQYDKIIKVLSSLESSCNVAQARQEAAARGSDPPGGNSHGGSKTDPNGWVKPTSYVLTGVGVVSGSLTGLGWWAFKRSKGDPWVRQI
ncbi:hypothetical protein BEWA_016230 [Theileria equi strain WA]|uniref:Uncharacterized protein n=1 Tax=Theileria equi strain WA TaxID=1537102 RepID=L1LC85_THEEQ|nr:hypothetical protein BEWA_016230 [Theileria equi strain WA]EKX73062.1 hypothetical protein BEWA_016230 [Theileria equi strain WA]|eukprot:XP_004832514.1 hypothetical protein BEWA_016230 [Theileria equi strain WA]